jgi:hypothetical protein
VFLTERITFTLTRTESGRPRHHWAATQPTNRSRHPTWHPLGPAAQNIGTTISRRFPLLAEEGTGGIFLRGLPRNLLFHRSQASCAARLASLVISRRARVSRTIHCTECPSRLRLYYNRLLHADRGSSSRDHQREQHNVHHRCGRIVHRDHEWLPGSEPERFGQSAGRAFRCCPRSSQPWRRIARSLVRRARIWLIQRLVQQDLEVVEDPLD